MKVKAQNNCMIYLLKFCRFSQAHKCMKKGWKSCKLCINAVLVHATNIQHFIGSLIIHISFYLYINSNSYNTISITKRNKD